MLAFVREIARQTKNRFEHILIGVAMAGGNDVFQNVHRREKPYVLKCARYAEPRNLIRAQTVDTRSVNDDIAGSRLVNAGQKIEDSRFSRAVRSDQTENLTLFNLQ